MQSYSFHLYSLYKGGNRATLISKIIWLYLFISIYNVRLSAQIFTRITSGNIVNDGGSSFGHSWGDYNGDGWEDLYVNNLALEQSNFFYQNNGDGTFQKITNLNILQNGPSTSSTWGDFNEDGFIDLFVANGGTASSNARNFLFLNDGDGNFNQIQDGLLVNLTGAYTVCSWVDLDQNGLLDLFVGQSGGSNAVHYNNGTNNFAFQSLSDNGNSWGIGWSDYDNDGDLDAYAANWGSQNYFYQNNDGQLSRINIGSLTIGTVNSLSPSWGDFDNDGNFDLFLANSGAKDQLFLNNGDGTFTEIHSGPIVQTSSNSESSCWLDMDNDADLDLMVSGGGNISSGKISLFENLGDGQFSAVDGEEIVTLTGRYEGLSCIDYDKDGDLDVFASNYFNNDNLLYQNNGNNNNWFNVKCIGTSSNQSGIGTRIELISQINGNIIRQFREVVAHNGHVVQGSLSQHFGLGNSNLIDSLIINWPSGIEDTYVNLNPNDFFIAIEGQTTPISDITPKSIAQLFVYPNPASQSIHIQFNSLITGAIEIGILNSSGQQVYKKLGQGKTGEEYIINWQPKQIKAAGQTYYLIVKMGSYHFSEKIIFTQ